MLVSMARGFHVAPVLQDIARRDQCSSDLDSEALVGCYAVKSVHGQLHGEIGEISVPRVSVGRPRAIGRRSISEIQVVGERWHTSLLRLPGERE